MSIEPLNPYNIAQSDPIELGRVSTTGRVHWEEDRPCHATPHEAEQDDGPEKA